MEICVQFTVWYLFYQLQAFGLSRPHTSKKMAVASQNLQIEQSLSEQKFQPESPRNCSSMVNNRNLLGMYVFQNAPLNLTVPFNAGCVGTHGRNFFSGSCHNHCFVSSCVIICSAKIFSDIRLKTLSCGVQHE